MEPAIQVSPVKEEEMSFVKEVFQRMADNVVAASHLSVQVAELQRTVDTLQGSVERLKNEVTYYSDQATAFRRKSEELDNELSNTKGKLSEANFNLDRASHTVEELTRQRNAYREQSEGLTQAVSDRDNQVAKLHEENEMLHKKLADIRAFTKSLFPDEPQTVLPHDNPVAVPEVTAEPSAPVYEVQRDFPPDYEPPVSPPEPSVIWSNEKDFDWSRNDSTWDKDKGLYKQTKSAA